MPTNQDIEDLESQAESLVKSLDKNRLKAEIKALEYQLSQEDVWQDQTKARKLNQDLSSKNQKLSKIEEFEDNFENLRIAQKLDDQEQIQILYDLLFKAKVDIENHQFLNGKFDDQNALLTVHAGAGGVDAQDWAAMLMSMYQAFAKSESWEVVIVSLSSGEEGGLKSGMLEIRGENVYGLLKEEVGVHRLVRLSPFNSGHTRETSFALVEVIPDNLDKFVDPINLKDEDLKWDTFMSGGNGGQSVNTTYSAVRVTHLPTGTVVTCQNERNQLQNKAMAIKYLGAKLAVLEAKEREELKSEVRGEFHSAEWGNQIRNYVLHPYKLVKDTRSGFETRDVDKILKDGQILDIIWSVKRQKALI